MPEPKWITTECPEVVFENTNVGQLKKAIWDASEEEIEMILEDYGIPADGVGQAGMLTSRTLPEYACFKRERRTTCAWFRSAARRTTAFTRIRALILSCARRSAKACGVIRRSKAEKWRWHFHR